MRTKRGLNAILVAAALVVAWVGSGAAFAADPAMTKDLHIEQRAMASLAPPAEAGANLAVKASLDRADGIYKKGDVVVLKVQTTEDAYVWVFDTGTSGKVHQIFPNRYAKNNFVKAGTPVIIPGKGARYKLAVNHPRGAELLTVVASRDEIALTDGLMDQAVSAGPFRTLRGNASSVAKDLSVTLEKEKAPWSRDQVVFHIR